MAYSKKFISLDLETTHLDVREGKIMEIGAVEMTLEFDAKEGKIKTKFGKTFDQLVNPEIAPSETALMITGITKEELVASPKWREVKADLEKFIAGGVILGHNIQFDLGYLINQGMRLKNDSLDTLDVVVTLLPLLESHSLEYLGEYFQVLEGKPHRALVDTENAGRVLAAILNEFLRYPASLQKQIKEVLQRSKVEWKDLVLDLPGQELGIKNYELGEKKETETDLKAVDYQLEFKNKTIFCFPLTFNAREAVLPQLAAQKHSGIVAVPHELYLHAIPEEQKITPPRQALCEVRFARLCKREDLPAVYSKILIKILILRELFGSNALSRLKFSWTETPVLHNFLADPDLCPGHDCAFARSFALSKNRVYFSDLEGLFTLARDWNLEARAHDLMLVDLSATEDEFTEDNFTTWNLRRIRNLFSILYPLEKESVSPDPTAWGAASMLGGMPAEIESVVNELDLFFGILHLVYLKKQGEFAQNLVVDDIEREQERFTKLFHPAQKLIKKLTDTAVYLSRPALIKDAETDLETSALRIKLERLAKFLTEFFTEQEVENVYWLKFNDTWVDLSRLPKNLAEPFAEFSKKFHSVSIADNALPKISLAYFQSRLGLKDFSLQPCPPRPTSGRGEAGMPSGTPEIPVQIFQKSLTEKANREFLESLSGRTLVILPNETKLGEAYQSLTQNKARIVHAYKLSGSVGQIKSRLAKNNPAEYTLLLTLNSLRYWKKLPVTDNLVIQRLPFEASGSKPGLLGLAVDSAFIGHVLPRAVHLLHTLICKFLSAKSSKAEDLPAIADAQASGRRVFIMDPRILNDYDQSFMKYVDEFPDFTVSTVK